MLRFFYLRVVNNTVRLGWSKWEEQIMSQPSNHSEDEVIIIDDPWANNGSPSSNIALFNVSTEIPPPSSWLSRSRWPVWSAAMIFTILLHTLIFGSLLLGSPGRKYKPPPSEGASTSTQNNAQGEFVSTLVLINDHSITSPEVSDDSTYVVMQQKDQSAATPDFAVLSSTPQLEIAGSEDSTTDTNTASIAAGDGAGRAMLFGRYMGQIKARIERAWIYPTPTSVTSFKCTAQIKQSKQGAVQEVTLIRCDGDPAWQLSLAGAIQSASPLSAPPDESVFANVVTLSFDVDVPR